MGYTEPGVPLQVTDVRLWLNNDPTTMTMSGANKVSEWRDSSGNLNHFTQATGANQPLFVANGINSQNGIKWDQASDQYLDCVLSTVIPQKFEVFIVWNINTGSTSLYPFAYDRSGTSGNRIMMYWFPDFIRVASSTEINAYAKTRPFGLIASDVVYNNTSTKVYENNVLKATVTSGSNSLTSLRLGHLYTTDSLSRLHGYICEMIIYAKELNTTERNLINNYLIAKYGL